MTYDAELRALLFEVDDIAVAIAAIESQHGPHVAIEAAKRRQQRVREQLCALQAERCWSAPAISGPH